MHGQFQSAEYESAAIQPVARPSGISNTNVQPGETQRSRDAVDADIHSVEAALGRRTPAIPRNETGCGCARAGDSAEFIGPRVTFVAFTD